MSDTDLLSDPPRSSSLRLRTLVFVRWAAILGQTAAIVIAVQFYGFQIQYGLASLAIGASIIANLMITVMFPTTRRMTETEAALMLVFDILQLGLLLYLTGGLHNPFALLILAPVTIAASVLSLRRAVSIALVALVLISALAVWNLPILSPNGHALSLPGQFLFGFWLALSIGVLFLAVYARQVTTEIHSMREALVATQMALAREQKLTDLGGVVAAAAHELGTPLATIKLVSSEMVDMLADQPDLLEDAELIRSQADRCREILQSMGRAGKDDLHLRRAPLQALVREAAEPHMGRGKSVDLRVASLGRQPVIQRKPEVIHGLRNLIQNAVDFAETRVAVEMSWNEDQITVRIEDDGAGFAPSVLSRIGDPFVHRRMWEDGGSRPGYDGMGLGLFIAKTLLERTGAKLAFANGRGAIVIVTWPSDRILASSETRLGPNVPVSR